MWKLEFRRGTLLWLLAAAFVLGLGIRIVQHVRGRAWSYPVTVVRDDAAFAEFHRRADSIMTQRLAAARAPVNINTAAVADFERLNGIGPALAERIVDYRRLHGPFSTVDDLVNVTGIGPKRLAAIRDRCVVDSL